MTRNVPFCRRKSVGAKCVTSRIWNGSWREMFDGFTHQEQLLARNVNGFAHPEHVWLCLRVIHLVIPAHLLAVCVLSGRRALGGAARCTTVSASRALEQASRIRRRVDVPSRQVSGTASCWKRTTRAVDVTHRRRRWIKRTWKILDTLHNHRRNHRRQGWRVPDNTDFSTELSISGKQMEASRKDEFCRPVRTSLASAIDFWLALKMTWEGKDEKNVFFFFILRERKLKADFQLM